MIFATLIRGMAAAGAPSEAIALAVGALEDAEAKLAAQRESARDRKRAQRARDRDSHVTVTGQSVDSHAIPLSRPLPPQTPPTPTHSPGYITTRARGFAEFWSAYPNKVGKAAAERAYAKALKAIPGPDPPGLILAAVERARVSRGWGEGYIPHPTTWLNRGSWDDEPAEVIPFTGKSHDRPNPTDKLTARHENYAASFEGAERAARRDREF